MAAMDPYLSFWNYMGFDYARSFSTLSGHSANLYPSLTNPSSTPFDTISAITYYLTTGSVPASKINIGSPLYGHAFASTTGPGAPFNDTGPDGSFGGAGTWDYKALPLSNSNATVHNLPDVGASYSYDSEKEYMISYDNPVIAKQKAAWVREIGLGGAMWWEVSMDRTGDESLVGTTVEQFGGVNGLEKSENQLEYPMSKYENLRNGFPGQ